MDKIRRIALVGNGATTRASDGFEGEIWTTASVAKILPRVDRVFEVHKEYDAARLNGYKCPIMTDGVKADLSMSEDLRIDSMVENYGPLFQFSFDYMIGAIISRINVSSDEHIEITTYGIDLTTDSEYNQFRQSFFYWIGFLRGAGITINISQGSAIFNRRWVYCHERDEIAELSSKLIARGEESSMKYQDEAATAHERIAFSNGYRQCAIDLRDGV